MVQGPDGKLRANGIEEKCVACYNEQNGTNFKEKEFESMAREVRYRTFNRVDKAKITQGDEALRPAAVPQVCCGGTESQAEGRVHWSSGP